MKDNEQKNITVLTEDEVLNSGDSLYLGTEVHFDGGVIRCNSGNVPIKICGGGSESEVLEYGEGGTNIIAGDYQIFYGLENIQFCGKWNITGGVYASWFGMEDTNALLIPQNIQRGVDGRLNNDTKDDIDVKDNSIAINTAIKLKGMGEVRLPQGTFCIKNHIRVTSGIQLIGVGPDIEGSTRGTVLYPYYNKTEHGEKSSYQIAYEQAESNYKSVLKVAIEATGNEIDEDVYQNASAGEVEMYLKNSVDPNSEYYKDVLISIINAVNTHLGREDNPSLTNESIENLESILKTLLLSNAKIKLSDIPFPLHTEPYSQDSAELEKIEVGYMIVANICNEIKIEFSRNDTSNITGISYFHNIIEKPTRPRVTRISGIDLVYWESIYKYTDNSNTVPAPALRHHYKGILFEGKIEIDNVRSFGLTQLCSNAYIGYSDNRYVHDNTFSLGVNQEYALGFPKPIYGFDLSGLGDALRFCGNHAASYHNMIGSLRIDQCKGGVIQGNILNSDVMINRSHGITYNGNHSEYGIKLDIRGSSVTVCDNVFWKGTHPNIRIRRVQWPKTDYLQCVTLQNNTFVNFMKNLPGISNNITDLCDYDVVTDGWANITVENCYRTRFYEDVNEFEPTGITMGLLTVVEETQVLEPYYYDTNEITVFPMFNDFSHIYSIQSVVCGKNVTTGINRSAFIDNDFSIGINEVEADTVKYKHYYARKGLSIQYTITEIYDYSRRLGKKILHGGDEKIEEITMTFQKETSFMNITLNTPSSSNVKRIAMMRIERYMDGKYSYVDIPVCGATLLLDDGEYLNGYRWSNPMGFRAEELLTEPLDIAYKGDNIECSVESFPIIGSWKNGDVVWCGSDSMRKCYIKREDGWYEVSVLKYNVPKPV